MTERVPEAAAAAAMFATAAWNQSDEGVGEAPRSGESGSGTRPPSPEISPEAAQRAARHATCRQDLAFQAAMTRAIVAGTEKPPRVGIHTDPRPLAARHRFAPVPHASGCTSPAGMCAEAAGLTERRPPVEGERTSAAEDSAFANRSAQSDA